MYILVGLLVVLLIVLSFVILYLFIKNKFNSLDSNRNELYIQDISRSKEQLENKNKELNERFIQTATDLASIRKGFESEQKKNQDLENKNKELNERFIQTATDLASIRKDFESEQKKNQDFESYKKILVNEFKVLSQEQLGINSDKFTKAVDEVIKNLNSQVEKDMLKNRGELSNIQNLQKVIQEKSQQIIESCASMKGFADVGTNFVKIFKSTDIKNRGIWGENNFQVILDRLGFTEGCHYIKEYSIENRVRLDYLLYLPNKISLIVECKTPSLVPLDEEGIPLEEEKDRYKKTITEIIKNLVKKDYIRELKKIQSEYHPLPYILLFIPMDRILYLISTDRDFMEQADKNNIIMVSPINILGYLGFFNHIWKIQSHFTEMEKNFSILEDLSKEFGRIYNKVIDFGNFLEKTQGSYNQLVKILNQEKVTNILKKYKHIKKKKIKSEDKDIVLRSNEITLLELKPKLIDESQSINKAEELKMTNLLPQWESEKHVEETLKSRDF